MSEARFDERYRCTATSKRSGQRCRRAARPGSSVCFIHGGGSPSVTDAGRRRLQRDRLNGELGQLLEELEVEAAGQHPVETLLDAVHRCQAMVAVIGAMVGGLASDALYGPDHLGDGRPHVLTEMYGVWLERAARASKLALDAGVAEREVRMTEAIGHEMADTLRSVLDGWSQAFALHLREVAPSADLRALQASFEGVVNQILAAKLRERVSVAGS